MVDSRNSGSDREAMLRRVAIVLSSLPASTAAKLLGSLEPQIKQAVRRTMTSLADVDPLERRRALRAFKVSVEQEPPRGPAAVDASSNPQTPQVDDLIEPSSTSSPISSRIVSTSVSVKQPDKPASPLAFLGDVQDDALVSLLVMEPAQAVALVLASIAPAQAARVLPRLDSKLQTEALSRIGRLGEIPETATAEIAEHFQHRLANDPNASGGGVGQQALHAILAAMPKTVEKETPLAQREAVAGNGPVAGKSHAARFGPVTGEPSVRNGTDGIESMQRPDAAKPITAATFPSADIPAIDLAHKIRVAEHSMPEADLVAEAQAEQPRTARQERQTVDQDSVETGGDSRHGRSSSEDRFSGKDTQDSVSSDSPASSDPPTIASTDAINEHLINLTPMQLCQALGKVDTRDAMLALCGLPNQVAESVLAILPRAQAKQVRMQMVSLNTLHLREIDEAKERVSLASEETDGQAAQPIPVAA